MPPGLVPGTKWTVLERGDNSHDGRVQMLCRCECGVVKLITPTNLRRGITRQCHTCGVRNRAPRPAQPPSGNVSFDAHAQGYVIARVWPAHQWYEYAIHRPRGG